MSSAGSAGLSERSADVGAFTDQITALDQAHALGLTRLAHVMLSDAGAAEDVVQEAFCGLYRNWARRRLRASKAIYEPAAASAESVALTGEEHRSVLVAAQAASQAARSARPPVLLA